MDRIAIYIAERRIEWACWNGERLNSGCVDFAGDPDGAVEALVRSIAPAPTNEVAVFVSKGTIGRHAGKHAGLVGYKKVEAAVIAGGGCDVRLVGDHVRASAAFGLARGLATCIRRRSMVVGFLEPAVLSFVSYQSALDDASRVIVECDEDGDFDGVGILSALKRIIPDGSVSDTTVALFTNEPISSEFENAVRELIPNTHVISPDAAKGAMAIGLLFADIVLLDETKLDDDADSNLIKSALAELMDNIYDQVTRRGYDLDDVICRRELIFKIGLTGNLMPVECGMLIDVDTIRQSVQGIGKEAEAGDIGLVAVRVIAFVEPIRPDIGKIAERFGPFLNTTDL